MTKNKTGSRRRGRPYRVEYLRPDGWWYLQGYASEQRAMEQMKIQMSHYPNAHYRVVEKMTVSGLTRIRVIAPPGAVPEGA